MAIRQRVCGGRSFVGPTSEPGTTASPPGAAGQHWPIACFALLLLLLLSIITTGCARRYPMPDLPNGESTDLLRTLQVDTPGPDTARGFARMEVFGPQGRVRVDQVVLAERPARLRIETLSPFDQPISYLTTDGDRFSLYSLEEKTFYVGAANAANLSRIIPINLEPEALVEALLGGLPTIAAEEESPPRWDRRRGVWVLRLRDDRTGLQQEIHMEPKSGRAPFTRILDDRGRELYSLEFGDRKTVDGVEGFPHRIRFRMPGEKLDITFRWREVELDRDLPGTAWHLEPPRGVPVEVLD